MDERQDHRRGTNIGNTCWYFIILCVTILLSLANVGICYDCPKEIPEFVYEFAHNDKYPDRKTAYFREDLAMDQIITNYHFYDVIWLTNPEYFVDRSGEVFTYFHWQVVARYESERISVGLPELIPFDDYKMNIPEAYLPKYPQGSTKYTYYGRVANTTLRDCLTISINDLINWTKEIKDAINNGYALHENGSKMYLVGMEGFNAISHIAQSAVWSPNHKRYGCLHVALHTIFGRQSDPTEEAHNNYDIAFIFPLAMMDPISYNWHKGLVNMLWEYKLLRMDAYKKEELSWSAVKLHSVSVIGDVTKRTNELTTFTQKWKPILNHGLDFFLDYPIKVLFNILNHEEFSYKLVLENLSDKKVTATVRLMLAPISYINGTKMLLHKQARFFIEMDKFKARLPAWSGKTTITQHSTKSWVTIPLSKSTEDLFNTPKIPEIQYLPRCSWPDRILDPSADQVVKVEEYPGIMKQKRARKYCGWPHHLQIPRGNATGVEFVLFAMVTNWDEDKAQSAPEQDFGDASAYCGGNWQKYPDKKAMGFPFDRQLPEGIFLKDFLLPNMNTANIKIFHSNKIVEIGGTFKP